jgi:hypothetical protein
MRRHPRHREATRGDPPALPVTAALPVRIGENRLPPDLMEGDILRRVRCRGGDGHGGKHHLRIARRPLQRLHAPHRAADDGEQPADAKVLDQPPLRAYHVTNGDRRKIGTPEGSFLICHASAGTIVAHAARAGGAHAATEHVDADHEKPVGVDRSTSSHHQFPPTATAGDRVAFGEILIAGQGVADQDGVGCLGVERAIGAIGQTQARQMQAAVERQAVREFDVPMCKLGWRSVLVHHLCCISGSTVACNSDGRAGDMTQFGPDGGTGADFQSGACPLTLMALRHGARLLPRPLERRDWRTDAG